MCKLQHHLARLISPWKADVVWCQICNKGRYLPYTSPCCWSWDLHIITNKDVGGTCTKKSQCHKQLKEGWNWEVPLCMSRWVRELPQEIHNGIWVKPISCKYVRSWQVLQWVWPIPKITRNAFSVGYALMCSHFYESRRHPEYKLESSSKLFSLLEI